MTIKLLKEKSKGKNYQADKFKILYRYKDTITGDNSENKEEVIYLITGKIEFTLKEEVKIIKAPAKLEIPKETYHKIKALTDINFILYD